MAFQRPPTVITAQSAEVYIFQLSRSSSRSISLGRHVLVQYSYPIALSTSSWTRIFNTLHVTEVSRLDVTYVYELAIISCAFRPFTGTPTFKFICVTVQVKLEHTVRHHESTETVSREPRSTATSETTFTLPMVIQCSITFWSMDPPQVCEKPTVTSLLYHNFCLLPLKHWSGGRRVCRTNSTATDSRCGI